MHYSRRHYAILAALLKQENFVSWESIAEGLAISKRTIFREMDAIEGLAQEFDMILEKRPRIGVKLEATAVQRAAFSVSYDQCEKGHLDQEERAKALILALLNSKEPKKLINFALDLEVSETTISHDMDRLVPWFEKRNLQLVRRPGYGVYLEGNELSLRKATVDYLYEHYPHEALLALIENEPATVQPVNISPMALGLLDRVVYVKVLNVLKTYTEQLPQQFSENAFANLCLHLTIAVQRMLKGEAILIPPKLVESLQSDPHYALAAGIGDMLSKTFHTEFPESESCYITMHLKGAKLSGLSGDSKEDITLTNFELTRMALRLVKAFQAELEYPLAEDKTLLIGLVNHLRPAIARLRLGLTIRNPLLDQIKHLYPEIYTRAALAAETLKPIAGVIIPDSEVGYLAMHFGASIERQKRALRERGLLRVGLVCASGIGTSSLLASRLTEAFSEIFLVGQFSKLQVESSKSYMDTVDFWIATVALEGVTEPVIRVNPLFFKEDYLRVEAAIASFLRQGSPQASPRSLDSQGEREETQPLEDLKTLQLKTNTAMALLQDFAMNQLTNAKHQEDVIMEIAKCVAYAQEGDSKSSNTLENMLIEAFEAREKLGTTVLTGEGIWLLHARVPNPIKPVFQVWRPDGALSIQQIPVTLVVVIVTSTEVPHWVLDMLGHLSRGLLEDSELIGAFRAHAQEEARTCLAKRLFTWLKKAGA